MISFETYLFKKKYAWIPSNIKSLRPGDKIKYIGKGSDFYIAISTQGFPSQFPLIPNNTYTFIELGEVHGVLCVTIKIGGFYIVAPLEDFIKI